MIKTNEFWWHNAIDGSASTDEIKRQAEHCLWIALMLSEAVKVDVIKITNSDSSPSLTMWDVLDEGTYSEICKKHGLSPEDFVLGFNEED